MPSDNLKPATVAKPPDEATFAAPLGSAIGGPYTGITMKDLRDAALKLPRLSDDSFVRVSDDWWVKLENGRPNSIILHNRVMQLIQEHGETSRPNDKLRHGETQAHD